MNMFESLVKSKEDHVIDHYGVTEGEEKGLEENDGGAVREVKKMYVEELMDEIVHHGEDNKK